MSRHFSICSTRSKKSNVIGEIDGFTFNTDSMFFIYTPYDMSILLSSSCVSWQVRDHSMGVISQYIKVVASAPKMERKWLPEPFLASRLVTPFTLWIITQSER